MKTFDEALKLVGPEEITSENSHEIVQNKFADVTDRYKELINEVIDNTCYKMMLAFWIQCLIDGNMGLQTILFNAFVSGLMTGIEMEKIETTS